MSRDSGKENNSDLKNIIDQPRVKKSNLYIQLKQKSAG